MNRERVLRTLTFWLRPEFVLRVINRFQKIAGFDRSVALASAALTATIPLSIVASSLATSLGGKSTADRLIERYDLTGGGAEAVYDIFAPPTGTSTSVGVLGGLFLLIAVLSFTRAVQRLFEQSWELAPLAAAFLIWTGSVLSAKRISRRDLIPFGLLGASLLTIYSVGATVYVPHLFSTYATRYGVIGAVFAMISALFCVMVVVVGSAAAGREIHDELDRIRRGERPADNEVRRQWDEVTTHARSRWDTVRAQIQERRRRKRDAEE